MIGDIMQPTHLLFVFVIALLVLGPKRLPEVGRQLGNGIRDFRAAISGEHTEDEDESVGEDDTVLAPAAAEPAVEQTPSAPPAEDHVADETVQHSDSPTEHELVNGTVEQSTLPADHELGDETVQHSATSAEHELAHDAAEQSTLSADHELPVEAAEPPTAPIEPAVAHTPSDSAPGNGVAAEPSQTSEDHSFATESSAPAENTSDRVA